MDTTTTTTAPTDEAEALRSLDGLIAFLEAEGIDRPCWEPRRGDGRSCVCGHPLDHHHPSTEGALL